MTKGIKIINLSTMDKDLLVNNKYQLTISGTNHHTCIINTMIIQLYPKVCDVTVQDPLGAESTTIKVDLEQVQGIVIYQDDIVAIDEMGNKL